MAHLASQVHREDLVLLMVFVRYITGHPEHTAREAISIACHRGDGVAIVDGAVSMQNAIFILVARARAERQLPAIMHLRKVFWVDLLQEVGSRHRFSLDRSVVIKIVRKLESMENAFVAAYQSQVPTPFCR